MPDFPVYCMPVPPILTPFSQDSQGLVSGQGNVNPLFGLTSAAIFAANQAFFFPFELTDFGTAYQLLFWVGATASGNIDVGIYDASLNRIVSSGPTAQGTINTVQELNIANTLLKPGRYYLASAASAGTATVMRGQGNDENILPGSPMYEQTGLTAGTLPDPCAPVISTVGSIYYIGIGIQFVPTF
jgi:hypothetical protein